MKTADALRFIDTNVLLYSISLDPRDAPKQRVAEELLLSSDLALSVQVLQEFYAQATRPSRLGAVGHKQAAAIVHAMKRYPILDNSAEVFDAALALRERVQISIWDAMIVASAANLGCRVVLTEDMQHGQVMSGVRIVNPFA